MSHRPFTTTIPAFTPFKSNPERRIVFLSMLRSKTVQRLIRVLLVILGISVNGFVYFGFQHSVSWQADGGINKGLNQAEQNLIVMFVGRLLLQFVLAYFVLIQFRKSRKSGNTRKAILNSLSLMFFFYLVDNLVQGYFFWDHYHHQHLFSHLPRWVISFFLYIFIFLVVTGYGLSMLAYDSDEQRKQLKENQLSSELAFLKAQIDPHFLFNSLNNLYSMAQYSGTTKLAQGISKLSEMMKFSIYETNQAFIPLEKEIEYIRNFISLSQLRYQEHEITVHFSTEGNISQTKIVPMILIPFVENAFKHGFDYEKLSVIDIKISVSGQRLTFSCENSIGPFSKSGKSGQGGIGLKNVRRRLDLVYGSAYSLEITETESRFSVTLIIAAR